MKKMITIALTSIILAANASAITKTSGTLGGAAMGALAGQLIGKDSKSTAIGAGIGALAGLGWGAYKDKQAEELSRNLQNTEVGVVQEGDSIKLTLPGGVSFPSGSSQISSSFYGPLNSIANTLKQYPESRVVVSGFTDNTGSPEGNADLSQRRAQSVARYLTGKGVASGRLMSTGYGASNFIASNSTPEGRAMNRRVEIKILPLN
ncbi:MAG: OmpA family protein [Fusobacteriaceae bacterium]